ncbi:MAG TPA: serine hydrolase domain-containing protein [Vicinamibacterales bacterium]|nr:serine hydrolase domain-containing protein [Vicinamibacterales bacterium]
MRASRRAAVVTLFLCGALSLAPAGAQAPAPLQAVLADLDRQLTADFAADGTAGVALGVVAEGRLVWTRNFGVADAETRRPVTSDTAFRIGSITKQFTALALLQAVEDGRMRLTDPLEKYVPEIRQMKHVPAGTPPVTLLQVATMTAGIAREPECEAPLDGPVSRWTVKLLSCLPGTGYVNEPGTEYLYSNIGYALLGLAIERAVGRPFTEYVTERTFKPLGMTRTAFEPDATLRRDLARGYSRRGREGPVSSAVADRELDGRGYKVPNGAILSTVNDLAKFVAWELGQAPAAVLKRETQDANYRRVYSATNARGELTLTSGYGIGFQAQRRGEVVILGHGGSTAGYLASALFHRASGLGVVVLRNCDGCGLTPGSTASRILDRLVSTQ